MAELRYDKDLFKSTAQYYDRFRPPYPAELLDDLRARVPLGATSRLLDLACGTGQIAFALAADVGEVWAVDQEPEMIAFAAAQGGADLEVANVPAVATAGRDHAARRTLRPGCNRQCVPPTRSRRGCEPPAPYISDHGCVALLWTGTPWLGEGWQHVLDETLTLWRDALGARGPRAEGWEEAIDRNPHDQVLRRAGLTYEGMFEFSSVERWTVESLIGFTYSTSFLNRSIC